jgi:hypothetical protein
MYCLHGLHCDHADRHAVLAPLENVGTLSFFQDQCSQAGMATSYVLHVLDVTVRGAP